jgi:hypothetical protein
MGATYPGPRRIAGFACNVPNHGAMLPPRAPRRDRVRRFPCPACGATPGRTCTGNGFPREANHAERIAAAQAWLGKQLRLEL